MCCLIKSTVCFFFFFNYKIIVNYPDKVLSSGLGYMTPPAGSGCLTRKTKTRPTGTYCAENVNATFIDRSSFVEHLRSAAPMKNNHLVLHLQPGFQPHKHPRAMSCMASCKAIDGKPLSSQLFKAIYEVFDIRIYVHLPFT